METTVSVASKPVLEDYARTDGLSKEMVETMEDYMFTLSTSETTKELYLLKLRKLGLWLMKNGIKSFTNAKKTDINRFLASYSNNNTKNSFITCLRMFYKVFLNKPDIVKDLKYYREELEPITPSEVLIPEEVIKIANEAGKRRDIYKLT